RTGLSFRLAATLAAFAALCFIAPPGVVAFGHASNTLNCVAHVDMVDHGAAKGAGVNNHADHSTPTSTHQMTCCGLFCLSALPAQFGGVNDGIRTGLILLPAPEPHFLGQPPELPDRPPISLRSV